MNVAVMQPYLFPYIGYYQLVNHVDKFVIYDDANYIKRGFINRNTILDQGKPRLITLPTPGASINKPISALCFSPDVHKLLEGIRHAYSKAPYFREVYPLVVEVLTSHNRNISDICMMSIDIFLSYLGKKSDMIKSSNLAYDHGLSAADRIIAIARRLNATQYVNSIGGRHLYEKEYFQHKGLELYFLKPKEIRYPQGTKEFFGKLSMIDTLMWCSRTESNHLLDQYDLI